MKQFSISALVSMIIFSCINDNTKFNIKGSAIGVSNGTLVYLNTIDENGRERSIDTAIIKSETFKMAGIVNEPTIHFMSTSTSRNQLIFMLENSDITIDLNKDNIMLSKVKGSKSNEDFRSFQAGMDSIRQESRSIVITYRKVKVSDKQKRDSLHKILEKYSIAMQDYPLIYTQRNPDSYFSLNLINLETNKPKANIEGFYNAFKNLSSNLKNSPKGLKVEKKLDSLILIHKNSKI